MELLHTGWSGLPNRQVAVIMDFLKSTIENIKKDPDMRRLCSIL